VATAYYNSAFEIDGSVRLHQNGKVVQPLLKVNVSSIDVYSYTIIKTGAATFTVLAALTQFA
jgi:hypothetical protein